MESHVSSSELLIENFFSIQCLSIEYLSCRIKYIVRSFSLIYRIFIRSLNLESSEELKKEIIAGIILEICKCGSWRNMLAFKRVVQEGFSKWGSANGSYQHHSHWLFVLINLSNLHIINHSAAQLSGRSPLSSIVIYCHLQTPCPSSYLRCTITFYTVYYTHITYNNRYHYYIL